ncbi:RloB domain-containing protein [Methylorubrum thiocyanatum]|uniref:RloB domain-containing protein n=1 Tax=Methylorubrum thiocyanatum TaxID=47958 RepID=UPI00383A0D64
MRRDRALIPQRRRVFLACEGESEQSYGALLSRLIDTQHRRTHLDIVLVQPGGGDPLAIVERAIRLMRERVRRFGAYAGRAVLLDADKLGSNPERDRKIEPLAQREGLRLIWQDPCHEALLLRHLNGCAALRPVDTARAAEELQRRCANYRKGMAALRLANFIDVRGVLRAAAVEPALDDFLTAIEFPRD